MASPVVPPIKSTPKIQMEHETMRKEVDIEINNMEKE